jgi:YD repeat-containing protein
MTAMATTRDPAHESVNLWTLVPAGTTLTAYSLQSTALDLTQWNYDPATGLLLQKLYADNKGPSYTYTPDGKLATRAWAREVEVENVMVPVTTTYGYDLTGALESVSYNDGTPGVTYTHDHLGRPLTVTDALGTRTFVYDPATLALVSEQLPGGEVLSRTTDAFGRPAGLALGQVYAATYGYDTAGRFGSVTTLAPLAALAVQYGYVQGSDLLAGWSSNVEKGSVR